MKNGIKGACGELKVAIDLMERGYEVYRALGGHAKADLIAINEGSITRVEVRTVNPRKDGTPSIAVKPEDECDLYAFVCNGDIVYMKPGEARADKRIHRPKVIKEKIDDWRDRAEIPEFVLHGSEPPVEQIIDRD